MVYLTELWLPILLSAVFVFIASSIIHMVIGWHRSDYKKLPNEDQVLAAMRAETLAPGLYTFPHSASMKEMGTPEMQEKLKKGPVGTITIIPSGMPSMGKYLFSWFVFCLFISFVVAYLTGRVMQPGDSYLAVFRVAGTAAFLGYSAGEAVSSIWKGQRWGATIKHMFDGLIYALLTAGTFGWLWPR
jgi:hypothetical protein